MDLCGFPLTEPIRSLPDEVLADIIARVPRSYYPTISLVSRRFRSIVASPELYTRRSLLRCTEHCLYAIIYNPETDECRWYILRHKALVLVPFLPPMPAHGSSVSLGSKIYVLGGVSDMGLTSSALTVDCTSHTVQPISSIPKIMAYTVAGIIDGKIYVIGECKWSEDEISKRVAVLNTETQLWESEMTKPGMEIDQFWCGCVVMEGNIYTRDTENSFVYVPSENKWEMEEMLNFKEWECACVVDDILYYYDYRKNILRAYDLKHKCWGVVKGVERLLPESSDPSLPTSSRWSYAVSIGEKLVVFLSRDKDRTKTTEIWCAMIELERRQGGEIWGKVEWCDVVIDGYLFFVRCLAVMV